MKLLINILLMLASIVLFVLLAPLGILTTVVLLGIKDDRELFSNSADYPFSIAIVIDMLGNVVVGDLFNMILTKKGGYKFGKKGETISEAIGENILINKLTWLGWALNNFLNLFEKDHALKAVIKNL